MGKERGTSQTRGTLGGTKVQRSRAIFAEWLERTGDHRVAAERAGVSERTGRRWKLRFSAKREEVTRAGALTAPVTRFIGRQAALHALKKLFADGARLVSVLGPGGMGKTRVALRFAEISAASYEAGVYFVDLSTARTLEEVCALVLHALGVEPAAKHTEDELVTQAGHVIAGHGDVLIVLDNFEQAAPHASASVGKWIAMAPRARMLVTSREGLRVTGELSWYLEPMAPPHEPDDRKSVLASEAVQLFLDRAQLARPGYALPDADLAAVVQLVRRLDCNPLAIELAAARMGVLGPEQLLERLERRFELLVGGARDATARQASMRAALDWSWDLLPPLERAAFAQIAVFRSSFSVEAAEAVIELPRGEASDTSVLGALASLKQRSLVFTRDEGGRLVFDVYDGIRDYAREKLDAASLRADAARRHARYFVELFEQGAPVVLGAPRGLEDLLAAARFCFAAGDADLVSLGRRAVLAAGPWLMGRPTSLKQLHELALEGASGSDATVARILVARSELARMRGDTDRAESDAKSAIEMTRALGERGVEGYAEATLGYLEHARSNYDAAEERYARALDIAREIKDERLEAQALGNWALTERLRRHVTESLELAERALAIHRRTGDVRPAASMLTVLGTLHHFREQPERARRCYEEALELAQTANDGAREAVVLGNLANLQQETGDLEGARVHLERALELLHKLGLRRVEGIGWGNLGSVFFEMGRVADARDCYERAIALVNATGDVVHEALFSAHLGGALATMDNLTEAEARVAHAEELLLPMLEEEHIARAASLHRGHVELAFARSAEAVGDHEKAESLRANVRRRIEDAKSVADVGDDVRFTLRMLARALDRPSGPDSIAMRGSLTVTTDASHVRSPRGEIFSLEKRRPVRLVLKRLVDQRIEAPGKPLAVDDLLEAGWPGERVLREAGASRVYVALGTLRKLGLRDVILSTGEGYLLDPRVEVLIVSRL